MKQDTQKTRIIILLLLLTSATFAGIYIYNVSYNKAALAFATIPPSAPPTQTNSETAPIHITIQSVGIDIDLEPGMIHQGIWSVSEFYGNHLKTSATPGSNGNIVVYGHDSKNIFGPLTNTHVGDIITLSTKDGQTHTYRVSNTFATHPDNGDVIKPSDTEILTVYTCTGIYNEKRFIVQAQPIES